jgi:hypothetical protein
MNDTITLLNHVQEDLDTRKITVIDTNEQENCILAQTKKDRVLFIYTNDESCEAYYEVDLLSHVSKPFVAIFEELLKKNNRKLMLARAGIGKSPYCERIVTADEYNRLEKKSKVVKRTYKNALKANQKIQIDYRHMAIAIEISNQKEYFFKEEEAENKIKEAEKNILSHFCSVEEILLYQAQSW